MDIKEALADVVVESYLDEWLNKPNERFDNRTPQELLDNKEYGPIWRMIYVLRSGTPS